LANDYQRTANVCEIYSLSLHARSFDGLFKEVKVQSLSTKNAPVCSACGL